MSEPTPEREEFEQPLGEFTRRKMKIQLGDGPDQRGEVTVEMVRKPDDEDEAFSDWWHETERASRLLRERLGLNVFNPDPHAGEDEDEAED